MKRSPTTRSQVPKLSGHHSSRGMSLVEVLIAILLFSVGALAVVTMTTTSFRTNSNSYALDEGVNLARLNMDGLLGLNYNSAQLLDTNTDGAAGLLAADAASADYSLVSGRYNVFWNVARNVPVNGAKTLSVIVAWSGIDRNRQVVFQTIKAE